MYIVIARTAEDALRSSCQSLRLIPFIRIVLDIFGNFNFLHAINRTSTVNSFIRGHYKVMYT
jgi:hypothetical protein